MTTATQALPVFEKALKMCQAKIAAQSPQMPVLRSVEQQLEYLIDFVTGRTTDQSRLKDIILGIYAVREFETDDPAFADLLFEANNYAKLLRSGPWTP